MSATFHLSRRDSRLAPCGIEGRRAAVIRRQVLAVPTVAARLAWWRPSSRSMAIHLHKTRTPLTPSAFLFGLAVQAASTPGVCRQRKRWRRWSSLDHVGRVTGVFLRADALRRGRAGIQRRSVQTFSGAGAEAFAAG